MPACTTRKCATLAAADTARDATTLPLIRAAIERGIPILAICRGFQEMNVALGGSLHQAVQEVEGKMDHRENPDDTLDEQYGPRTASPWSPAASWRACSGATTIMVNSLHGQGLDRLASGIMPLKRWLMTAWSKRSRCLPRRASCWRCSGTRNGASPPIPIR
jgi:gamma-glutamyl-gamma-aminobutyrate hydrolase PuuD